MAENNLEALKEEQIKALVEGYVTCENQEARCAYMEEQADTLKRPVRSIMAYLVKAGVYVKPEQKGKDTYTQEQTTEMVLAYERVSGLGEERRNAVVAEYAEKFGKTEASIRAKLSRAGVYVKKEPKSKITGGKAETREDLVKRMNKDYALKLTEREEESLARVSKLALLKLDKALKGTAEDFEEGELGRASKSAQGKVFDALTTENQTEEV